MENGNRLLAHVPHSIARFEFAVRKKSSAVPVALPAALAPDMIVTMPPAGSPSDCSTSQCLRPGTRMAQSTGRGYSGLRLPSAISFFHDVSSLLIWAANFSGVPPAGKTPSFWSCSAVSFN